jgi:hypothetical protein
MVIKILRENQAQHGIGYPSDETCFCVHTLTSNPFLECRVTTLLELEQLIS